MAPMSLLACLCIWIQSTESASKLDYYNLHTYLFNSYNSEVRPLAYDSEVLQIYTSFSLVSINEVREKDQVLVSFGYIHLTWEDDFLSWEESTYGGIDNMVVPQGRVWRPDIVVGNSVENRVQLGFDDMPIRLNSFGLVDWTPSNLFETTCDINVRYYPFDQQVCNVVLETMVSDITEIDLVLSNSSTGKVLLDEYGANGQWHLISASMEKKDTSIKAGVYIKLTIQRRRTFYVLNIILPVLFLSFMGALVFILPADAGEKISLAITILLAYIVFLTIVSESMPQTSLQVSILAVYLTVQVAMSALSVVLSILVLRIYHKNPDIPVPGYIQSMVRKQCCKKILCHKNTVSPIMDFEELTTWQDVSKSLDIIFFWLFMIITIVATIVCLCIMMI